MYIGAHVSASGGVDKAIENARAIGADAVQIFGSSPRQWSVRIIPAEEIAKFQTAIQSAKIGPTFFHAPYLINLGSPDVGLREKSEKMLRENYQNAQNLGIAGVIFHIGSRKDLPWETARTYVVEALRRIFSAVSGSSVLAIENSAGGGNTVGSTLEEVGEIIDRVGEQRLAFCYDTAHGFESGVIDEYSPEKVANLFMRIEKIVGRGRLVAVHLNDSKTPCKSNSDRHENIGEGYIGLKGIKAFVRNSDFQKVPWYLEVPGFDGTGPDKKNVELVRKLVSGT
jgi:deoxyribonuclease-4